MAQVVYRANLSAANFPLLSELQGRSIIVKQYDNTYAPSVTSKEDADKDTGIPQIFYCHNVMPTAQGFQSVGYKQVVNSTAELEADFDKVITVRDVNENKAFLAHLKDGRNFVLISGSNQWLQINTIANTAGIFMSHAYVSGETYIYFQGIGCYKYNFATQQLVAVTLNGLTPSAIIGIVAAVGYLVAWGSNSIAWSSTLDPTDFVPSAVTGAGGGSVEGARGKLTVCVTNSMGFFVFTTNNAVAALYSGNARYPFNFKEIAGSGGLASTELITSDANIGADYAYTTSGVQAITALQAQTVFPEVTDFIAGEYFEDFNESTLAFSTLTLTAPLKKKLALISDRYIILSYGVQELTHALVFDSTQRRWGKLKVPHVDCFEWTLLDPEVQETPRKSLAFLQKNGTVKVVDFTLGSPNASGVLVLGKYQYIRQRTIQLQEVHLENIRAGANFKLYDLVALDGKNTRTVEGYLAEDNNLYRKYNFRDVGINHSLLLVGSFNLVSAVISFNVHGRR